MRRGLGPWVAANSRGGAPPLGGLGSGQPQREGGREEGKVMALVVMLFGEGDGF